MHRFKVEGPLEVPFSQGKAAKSISPKEAKEFWEHHPHLERGRGCYIFAIRAGRGITPAYVGKATKTFSKRSLRRTSSPSTSERSQTTARARQ